MSILYIKILSYLSKKISPRFGYDSCCRCDRNADPSQCNAFPAPAFDLPKMQMPCPKQERDPDRIEHIQKDMRQTSQEEPAQGWTIQIGQYHPRNVDCCIMHQTSVIDTCFPEHLSDSRDPFADRNRELSHIACRIVDVREDASDDTSQYEQSRCVGGIFKIW